MDLTGLGGLVLLLVTSCVAPAPRQAATATPPPLRDARALVRLLAPAASDGDLAAVPVAATPDVAPAMGAAPFLDAAASLGDAARARDCLTAAVYYEARSEPIEGQRAVAQVVLNRVRDRAFPHSVCGVVYQGVGRGRGCQFSFACDGSTDRPREPGAWSMAGRVATAALNGGVMAAIGNATFYHATSVLPWWAGSLTRAGEVGHHIFYRWPGAVERALATARYAGVEPGAPALGGGEAVAMASAAGVVVHRGIPAPAAPLASASATPVARHVSLFTAGVRIHRGEDAPVAAGVDEG